MLKVKFILHKYNVLKLHYKKLGIINLSSYILQRVCRPKNSLLNISIPGFAYPVFVRNIPSDTQIFTQIFLRDELKVDLKMEPKIIIDGGANIGLATLYFKNRYPAAKIFSIEPDQSNFAMLVKNTGQYKNISCYNNGIWNRNTRLKIINEGAGNESFVVAEISADYNGDNTIDAITLGAIVKDNLINCIDLLKLDIEGSERKVFEDNYTDWLSITENMLVEIHNWIDKEAEDTIKGAVKENFKKSMSGEYHFYTRL